MRVRVCVEREVCACEGVHLHVCACVCMCVYREVCACVYMCACVRVQIYIYISVFEDNSESENATCLISLQHWQAHRQRYVATRHGQMNATPYRSICQSTTKLSEACRDIQGSPAMVATWERDVIRGCWGSSAMAATLCRMSIAAQSTLVRPCLLATAMNCSSDSIEVLLACHMVAPVGSPVPAATVRALDGLRHPLILQSLFGWGSLCPYMGGLQWPACDSHLPLALGDHLLWHAQVTATADAWVICCSHSGR